MMKEMLRFRAVTSFLVPTWTDDCPPQ